MSYRIMNKYLLCYRVVLGSAIFFFFFILIGIQLVLNERICLNRFEAFADD